MRCLVVYLVVFFLHASLVGQEAAKTICLNMIVKNESTIMARALSSVLPLIDYWVIVDTGSTDGTQQVIQEYMKEKGIPGELYERPWKNFAHNRNEALALAKGKADYVLFIDADEYLTYEAGFTRPKLDKDYYYMNVYLPGMKFTRIQLINNHQDWQWGGVLHEAICPPASRSFAILENVYNTPTAEGARSRDPQKYLKDAQILEAALKDEPDNTRYMFYLAQSYACANENAKAIEHYEKRVQMGGGLHGEIFWSLLQIAILQEALEMPSDVVLASYRRASAQNRLRAEPYYYIASYYRKKGEYEKGYEVAKLGAIMPFPKDDLLFVQDWIYDYGFTFEASICDYWCGRYKECQESCLTLLQNSKLPEHIRTCVASNLGFANLKLLDQICCESSSTAEGEPHLASADT